MSTADVFMEIRSGRLVGADDLKDRVLGYLKDRVADLGARVYNYPGVFTAFTLTSPAADTITVTGTGYAADGLGNILQPSLCVDGADNFMAGVGFENALGVTYYVVLKYAELPSGAQQNSKGFAEFTGTREFIGESGDPDGVTDNGNGTITFQINGLLEGVKSVPRKAYVWLKVPQSSSSEHKQLCTISWNGAANTITTTHKLGQTTVTTDASKYTVLVPGPSIRRYTNFEVEFGVPGYVNIGRVVGAGAGNVPVIFSTQAQNVIDNSLSSLNAMLDAYSTRYISTGGGPSANMAGTNRYNAGCVPFGGLIYVVGGDGTTAAGGCVSQVHSYNPGTNSWTVKASIPSQGGAPANRSGMGLVASASKIYLLGGGDESAAPNAAYSVVQVYDPNTNTWGSALASMPAARKDMFCTLIGDTIYVMGGVDNNNFETATVWSYSIANDAWTVLTPMANTYSEGGSATLNGTFYKVAGGKNTFTDAEVWRYDPAGGWTARASLPIALRGVRCIVHNGVLIACGGRASTGYATRSFYAYNESRNEWTDLGEMPGQPIRDHGFAALDGIAHVIGGITTQITTDSITGAHSKVDVSRMAIATGAGIVSSSGQTFARVGSGTTTITAKPAAMRVAPSVTVNGRVYFVCGETAAGAASQEFWCYHPETDTYERLADCPLGRAWGGAVYHARENAIYAFGGQVGGFPVTSLERYDFATKAWTSISVSPSIDRCGFGQAVLAGDKIYMFGGSSGGVTTASTGGQIIHLRSRTTSIPAALPAARRWTLNFGLPKSQGVGVADSGHHIYVMGGDAGGNVLSTIYVYDTDFNTFVTHGATLSANRGYAQVEPIPGTMKAAIIGGVAVTNTATNLVTIYDFATMTSTNITNLSASRLLPSGAYIGGLFYMFSGSSGTSAAMTGQTTASYTYDSAYAAPELSLPKNYTTGRTAHTFGVRSGHLYGAHSWLANEAAEFIVTGDQ